MPLVDEHRPKCHLCYKGFESLEELREHQNSEHGDFVGSDERQTNREPAPGDVTVF